MLTLLLAALVLLLASPALAADAGKPATTTIQGPSAPPVQSDAVKPLTQPNVVTPPSSKPVPPPIPKASGPAPSGKPAVSGPKTSPGGPSVTGPQISPGAPAAGPSAPTIPAAGTPGIDPKLGSTIRDANQLDAIRDLKQLEELNRNPMERGRPAGAGTDEGGLPRALGSGRMTTPPAHQGSAGSLGSDCLGNPQDCISAGGGGPRDILGGSRDGTGSGNAAGMGGPPTAAGAVPDPRGAVSGHFSGRSIHRGTDGSYLGTGTYHTSEGGYPASAEMHTSAHHDGQGNWTFEVRLEITNGRGDVVFRGKVVDVIDSSGNRTRTEDTREGIQPPEDVRRALARLTQEAQAEQARKVPGTQGGPKDPASMPSEDPNTGNDGCGWAPIHGCLNPREDIRTSVRQRTTQPGVNPDGAGTEGGTGSSRGGSTGPEAVTNTGDGSFGTERGGGGSQGTPIWQTMPDPARGGPGGPATGPGTPARRAGSDAGIDAGTGALPAPPPR